MSRGFPILLVSVLLSGIAALSFETDGFRVVTSAGARQWAIARAPLQLPDASLIDQDGKPFSLANYGGRPLLVDFIYTRCPTICTRRGDDFAHVARLMEQTRSSAPIDLLSISFDPADDRAALGLYGERFGAKPPRWRIAAPLHARDRDRLLQAFGVVVIPDGFGGFIHNDAIYLVDASGRLTRILDPDTPAQILAAANKAAEP